MPSANLDLVRSLFAAWERGDFSSSDWAHPEIEWAIGVTTGYERGTGLAALTKVWRIYLSMWDDFHAEADEYLEADGERVLVLAHFIGRGKWSGLDIGRSESEGASLFHVRGGKVTKLIIYLDRERVLADLGLAPEAGS
jgi:ketosteroid isomerase-like protein